ncbi:helix-turn-helix domain-containing protein [Actinopolymorpha alba]|uniref:helix-turn-helix domain-containing protein n=1 Tax=Actinopolymorpha alba TaxID=533267 RepID=UPI00035C3D71|nr:helix-turn-helix transcriptional regulator [Actinopolymorpha alba]
MSDKAYGATVAKRRLARRLSELRVEAGYTANQVCDRLNWGRGKVGRFEANIWVRPEMSDIRDLLRIYGADEETSKELEDLAALARTRAWWRDYNEIFDNEFPGYESDAVRVSVYTPLVLPGLLQTPAYMEAHMRVGSRSSAWRNRAVGARLRRQEIFDRKDDGTAPELVAVFTEASLMYRWGAPADRRAQIAHLVEMGRRPNIELRLLRFADGPHPGMCGPINTFDFPGDEPKMVYVETDFALQEVVKAAEVDSYTEIFTQARAAALEPPATTAHLKQLAETLE